MRGSTHHITQVIRNTLLCVIFGFAATRASGQIVISSTPAAANDTINLCSSGNTSVSFSASGSGANGFQWDFGSGSPATANGAGPHSVNFASPGTSLVTLYTFDNSLPRDTLYRYVITGSPASLVFVPSDTNFCVTAPPYLINGTSPGGGYYTGPGVSGNFFDPSAAGVGTHKIIYHYMSGSCHDTISRLFTVIGAPSPHLAAQGSPIMFNGQLTYSRCVPASSVFNFYTTTNSSTYTSYSIDFGDGSTPQTGTVFPTPALGHSFAQTGIYKVALTIYGPNGCPATDTVTIFYGSNPSVGLSITGNNIKCLPRDSSGITFWFPITNTSNNPPGTVYEIEVNDGTPPMTFNHPPPDSVSHTFYEPSCGYNTANFNNAFQVKITAKTPCVPNSVATVEPILISDPPTAAFDAPPRICYGRPALITDQSWGSQNALTGCDTNVILVWEISPSSYTVNSGYMGNMNNDPNPMNWYGGTQDLEVTFNKTGYYTVRQYVGNQAGCDIDTMIKVICVDSLPSPDFSISKNPICVPDTLTAFYLNNIVNFCDTTGLQWNITPNSGYTLLTGDTDSLLQAYFFKSGIYTVTITSSNMCDTAQFSRTFKVRNAPSVFMPADMAFCGLRDIDFGQPPFAPRRYDSLGTLSYEWEILPASGWSYLSGTDTSAAPVIDFNTLGTYTIIHTITNACGTDVDTMVVSFYEVPTLDSVPDTLICYGSDYYFKAHASGGLAPYYYSWNSSLGNINQSGDSIYLSNLTVGRNIQVSVTDSLGCSDTTEFYVEVAPKLTANAGSDQILCYTDTTNLLGFASGGYPPYTYHWSPATNVANVFSATTLRYPMDSTVNYVLEVTDSLGCVAYDTVKIEVYPLVNVDAGPDQAVCYDSVLIPLNFATPAGGTWQGNGVSGNYFDPMAAGLGLHTLHYYYQDANSCRYEDTVRINVINIPQAKFTLDNTQGCSTLNVQASDSSSVGVKHIWYVNGQLASNALNPAFQFTNNSATKDSIISIKLVIQAGTGCKDSSKLSVIVHPRPKAAFSIPASVCANDSVMVTQNSLYKDSATYIWEASSPAVKISDSTVSAPVFSFGDNQSGQDSIYTISLIIISADGCRDTTTQNITIHSRPVADFSLPAAACSPVGITPTDLSSGRALSYQWSVAPTISIAGANTSQPTFNFPVSFNDSVLYTIHLAISDSNGCTDTLTKSYTVYPRPTAAFTPSVNDSCGPMSVTFYNSSSPNLSGKGLSDLTFYWDFGNGQTSTDSVPTMLFTNNGISDTSYYVSLQVTNAFGCTDTVLDTITVHPDPRAQMLAQYAVNCAPFTIDSSVVSAVQYPTANDLYIWQVTDLGGNILYSDTGLYNFSYTILQDGDSVKLRLIATGLYGCKNDSTEQIFYTITSPRAAFAVVPDSGCSPLTVNIVDSSSSGVSHSWYLNDSLFSSASNPVFTIRNLSPDKDTSLTVKLIVTAGTGCQDSVEHNFTVFPKPLAQFSMGSSICPGDSLSTINQSVAKAGASYLWSVSSPAVHISNDTIANPWFSFSDNQSGFDSTYTVSLIVNSVNGCSDSTSQTVTIFSRPVADFSLPAAACSPTGVLPTDLSSGKSLSYNWSVSPSITMSGAQTANPSFQFPVSFNDSVVYTVRLMVTDSNGCADSARQTYTVYPRPSAAFYSVNSDSCGPFRVSFINLSSPNQSGMTLNDLSFYWDLGNGQTSTDSTPVVMYSNGGTRDTTYRISLITTNAFGCSDTIADSIVVHPDPQAQISYSTAVGCAPFAIDTSVVSATAFINANQQYYWQLLSVSGNLLSQDTGLYALNYNIAQPGDSVYLRLIASSPYSCANDTAVQLFYTITNPVANFSPLPAAGCSPLTVTIADSSSPGVNRKWYVNNNLFSTATNPIFNFTNPNVGSDSLITIKLVVEAGTGCMDSIEKTITVHPKPVADFSLAVNGCPWDSVFVNNNSLGKAGDHYQWGASSPNVFFSNDTVASPVIVFGNNQSGTDSTYHIQLVITSVDGCSDTTSHDITIFSKPKADFSLPAPGCSPIAFSPLDSSSGSNLSYTWTVSPAINISNGSSSNPLFNFPVSTNDSVTYRIGLTLTDFVNGCVDSMIKTFTVYPKPTAGFTVSTKDSCGPFTLDFVNTSSANQSGMNRADMSFLWDFGNGQTSTDSVPVVTFTNVGFNDTTYTITLIASNAFGCSDTLTDSITVHPDPKATLSVLAQSDCAPFMIDTTAVGQVLYPNANSSYQWQIMDASTRTIVQTYSRLDSIHYLLSNPGDSVIIRLIANSPYYCKSDTVEYLFFAIGKAFPGFIASTYQGCSPLSVNFTDTVPGFVSWSWYVNGQLISTAQNPSYTFTNSSLAADSTYEVKLVAGSSFGCLDSVIQSINVYAPVDPQWAAANSCLGDSIHFSNSTQSLHPVVSWRWSFGDGSMDTVQNPVHHYSAPGKYTVSLIATSSMGCTGSYVDTVSVYPRPVADFNIAGTCGTDTVCLNQSFILSDASTLFSLGGNITQWGWDINADGSVEYTTQNPSHTFSSTGNYTIRLIATSQYGCSDTVEKTFFVKEPPTAWFSIDSVPACGPYTTTVADSSFGMIDSYLWQVYVKDSSGAPIVIYSSNQANPNPLPTFQPNYGSDTTYYIGLTVANCCGSSTYTDSLVLKSLPIARMLPSVYSGCTPLDVNFQLDGLVKGRPDFLIMNYGDGTVDTLYRFYQINPVGDTIWVWGQQSHRFVNTNLQDTTFNVQLTAINSCGDSTVSLGILVHPNNVQAFIEATPDQGCAPLTVTIVDRSFGGTNTTWCLDYDTTTATCNQPTAMGDSIIYTYNTPGTYVIAQFVNDGCSGDTAYKTITVYPSPTAAFSSSNPVCEDNTITFTNQSTTGGNAIAGYFWKFGDGGWSFLQNPVHTYSQPGVYTVCMGVTSVNGCMDSICQTVTIYDRPEVNFSAPNACFNAQPITFYDSSSVQSGQIISTLWKFGDGNTSVAAQPRHSYAAPGMYNVTLIHSSSLGCIDSATKVVNIFPISVADFNFQTSQSKRCGAPQNIVFNNLSASSAGYYWDFDFNGQRGVNTSTLVNPSFIYMKEGAYDVLLVAYNPNGCADSIIKQVLIRPYPKAGFVGKNYEGCAPLTVEFEDTSTYKFNGPGGINNWYWDFGDSTYHTGNAQVSHTYQNPGVYSVSLMVSSDGGCSDSTIMQNFVTVYATPKAGFTWSAQNSKTFDFGNTSTHVDGNTQYYWDFGDGKHSYEKHPTHKYGVDLFEKNYVFDVCLIASSPYGCADTLCKTIDLKGYLLYTPNAFAPDLAGAGAANYFLPAGHSMKSYHLQIFDEWGNVIFESTSLGEGGIPDEPWDGTHIKTGTPLPMGAYVWKIDAVFDDDTKWQGKEYGNNIRKPFGTVTLIR